MNTMRLFQYLKEKGTLPSLATTIVELGCHDGRILKIFYDAGYSVTGVDTDEAAIQKARIVMPKGDFRVGDMRNFAVPVGSFVIMRNSLPFLSSKEEVTDVLLKLKDHPMHFTLFGEQDERPRNCLWWTRAEVENICSEIGAILVEEFNGTATNMAGQPRRTHNFYCLKL